jgi:predicted enzyme related to lactoylglutathione lyase
MPIREHPPVGAPCWTDLWTSDVERSRRFYREVFGWESEDPNPEFGGYFNFTHHGVRTAGAMGDMGDMAANNTWKIYLASDDIEGTLRAITAAGGQVTSPAMPVADLGTQALFMDPGGAGLGVWQPGTFPGFTVLDEPGTPSWCELHTRDYAGALSFYGSVFGWQATTVSDTDGFRYSTVRPGAGTDDVGGIMDAAAMLAADEGARWSVYWRVDNMDQTVEKVEKLGGSMVAGPESTPYGQLATAQDPAGAQFKLRA